MSSSSAINLSTTHCVPCEGGAAPLTRAEFTVYLSQVEGWNVVDEKSLRKGFLCKNFTDAVELINRIMVVAEKEQHHPDLFLHDYKKLTVTLSTHAIDGLSVNDFVMAVKINELVSPQSNK